MKLGIDQGHGMAAVVRAAGLWHFGEAVWPPQTWRLLICLISDCQKANSPDRPAVSALRNGLQVIFAGRQKCEAGDQIRKMVAAVSDCMFRDAFR